MISIHEFEKNAAVLRRAHEEGVIDSSLEIYRTAPVDVLRWFNSVRSLEPKVPYLDLQQNPEALRSIVHTFERTPSDLDYTQDNLVELARFTVPPDNIGFLTNLEQYVADIDGNIYPTSAQFLGMPYNETLSTNDLVWHLQLQPTANLNANRMIVTGAAIANYESLLPGRPYTELPTIRGLWYPGSKRNSFSASIPSNTTLRLFVWLPASAALVYRWRCAGKISGQLQSSLCAEAQNNTRTLQ